MIARDLRVSERSVERWRRAWREGGISALASKRPAKLPRLSEAQFAVLEAELLRGPAAHGWEDQRWTLVRIKEVIAPKLRITCSTAGVWRLMHRHGWSWQCPARRALERDEDAVELWKKEVWPQVEAQRRRVTPGSSSRTRPGRDVAATRTHLGPTRPHSRGQGLEPLPTSDLIAALACYKPGQPSRLIYRPRFQPPCNTGRKGFGWKDSTRASR